LTTDWKRALDPDLTPLFSNLPRPVVYQAFPIELTAQPPANGWGTAWGGTGNDFAYAIAVDGTGASYVTGYYGAATDFGGGLRTNLGASDIYLVKFDPNGAYVWDKVFGNSSAQIGWALAVDSANNLYLGGQIRGDLDFGGGIMSAPTTNDNFLVSFDSNGNWRWQKYLPSTSSVDRVTGIAVDGSNNVYASMNWSGTADFGGGIRTGTDSAAESAIGKFTQGGTYVWDKVIRGPSVDVIHAIDVHPTGAVYATGYFNNTCDFGDGIATPTYPGSTTTTSDAFAYKLDAAGTLLWKKTYGQTGSDGSFGTDIAVDPNDGSCVVAGDFTSTVIDLGGGPVGINPGGSTPRDIFLVKLNTAGVYQWQAFCASSSGDQQPFVDIDNAGNVLFAGRMQGTYDFGLGAHGPNPGTFSSSFMVKYTSFGTIQWNSFIDSTDQSATVTPAQAGAYDIVTDAAGNVWTSGYWYEHADLDPGAAVVPVTNPGNNDAYLVKLVGTTGLW
ncbi:MAG TPA: hypothetical protein VEI97_00780, partial [bacterium]|nr:hypothetical protein [bacterium]